jgi:hypothetical protein
MDGFRAEAGALLKNGGCLTAFEQKGYLADLETILKALDGARVRVALSWQRLHTERREKERDGTRKVRPSPWGNGQPDGEL